MCVLVGGHSHQLLKEVEGGNTTVTIFIQVIPLKLPAKATWHYYFFIFHKQKDVFGTRGQ